MITDQKVYGLWANREGHWSIDAVKIDEVTAETAQQALEEGRKKWGKDPAGFHVVRSAILIPGQKQAKSTAEPMFLNE